MSGFEQSGRRLRFVVMLKRPPVISLCTCHTLACLFRHLHCVDHSKLYVCRHFMLLKIAKAVVVKKKSATVCCY